MSYLDSLGTAYVPICTCNAMLSKKNETHFSIHPTRSRTGS